MQLKLKKTPRKITPAYLHNAGLAYLQKFAASRKGFENVLMRKVIRSCMYNEDQDIESCRNMVADTVKKFERSGLLDDKIFATGLVSSLRRSGKSWKAITQKLALKGVEAEMSKETLQTFDTEKFGGAEESEMQAALKFAQKKKLKSKDPEKSLAAFARAGFSYDIARKILKSEAE